MDNKKRKLYGVIGDPVAHSLSPIMHQYWLNKANLPHVYQAFPVKKGQLASFMQAAETLSLAGFNVTFPHKRDIISYLDEIDEAARRLQAVNTVKRLNGKWLGYNTDGAGFIAGLRSHHLALPESSTDQVLIIGAGGSARAICFALSKVTSAAIYVANRTISRAEALILDISLQTKGHSLSLSEAESNIHKFQLVINTTTVGFAEQKDLFPLDLSNLHADTSVTDIIYQPAKTKFLEFAGRRGNRILNGLPMLIHQGALAFQHWHGIMPDTHEMEHFLTKKLEELYAEQ